MHVLFRLVLPCRKTCLSQPYGMFALVRHLIVKSLRDTRTFDKDRTKEHEASALYWRGFDVVTSRHTLAPGRQSLVRFELTSTNGDTRSHETGDAASVVQFHCKYVDAC